MNRPLCIESGPPSDLEQRLARLQNRRDILRIMGRGMAYGTLATLLPRSGDDDREAAALPQPSPEYTFLKRTSFGVHRDELARIRRIGIDRYLDCQLDPDTIDDGSLDAEIAARFPLTMQAPPRLLAGFPGNICEIATQMIGATHYRQIFSRRQLYEVMVEFWANHFNIHLLDGLCPTMTPSHHRAVIRAHALGNFGDLLRAVARSPAMLFYLDNFLNRAGSPNHHFARALLALHSLGEDDGFGERDIREVARCFTGWTLRFGADIDGDFGDFVFVDALHDPGQKRLLGVGIAAGGGQQDGERVLDLLARHPSTARSIATRLCRRFICDAPAAATVDAVAAEFTATGGDIEASLRALFALEAFRRSADLKITRPGEFLPAMARALAPDATGLADGGSFCAHAQGLLGQLPFHWPTPEGYPDTRDYWSSTGGWLDRWRLSYLGFSGLIADVDLLAIDYGAMLDGAECIADLVDAVVAGVLMRPVSRRDRDRIVDWLRTEFAIADGQWLAGAEAERLAALCAAVLVSSVYFQLR